MSYPAKKKLRLFAEVFNEETEESSENEDSGSYKEGKSDSTNSDEDLAEYQLKTPTCNKQHTPLPLETDTDSNDDTDSNKETDSSAESVECGVIEEGYSGDVECNDHDNSARTSNSDHLANTSNCDTSVNNLDHRTYSGNPTHEILPLSDPECNASAIAGFSDIEDNEISDLDIHTDSDSSLSSDDTMEPSSGDNEQTNDSDDEIITSQYLELFQGSPLSVEEFNAVLLALKQRHNFSNLALDSILKMLRLCLPDSTNLPTSSYIFEKRNERELAYSSTRYVTCMNCQSPLVDDLCRNEKCSLHRMPAKGENSSIFYVIDILPELKRLISGKLIPHCKVAS
ncbi:uncharacterized protein LOC114526212 isoform X2 [Dendronephthya gigantea]|uniref:uncharacterized protein LOC114526212 isoform X2 n=1 Tax=Dendronephthya gigantea TaxID=151771 RepID=UPI001068EF7D|nr:uncharacterized protein LOC114526212 isoform X2 [Dendronephthya gigantea]